MYYMYYILKFKKARNSVIRKWIIKNIIRNKKENGFSFIWIWGLGGVISSLKRYECFFSEKADFEYIFFK
jgi:hypothetical protein